LTFINLFTLSLSLLYKEGYYLRPPLEWRNCGGILKDLIPIGIIPIKPFGTHDFMGKFP
jgi:hypothetical protein